MDELFNVQVEQREIDIVKCEIGKEWKELGTRLGLSRAEIDAIEIQHQHYTIKAMAEQVILDWKNKLSEKATINELLTALRLMQQNLICSHIRKAVINASTPARPTQEVSLVAPAQNVPLVGPAQNVPLVGSFAGLSITGPKISRCQKRCVAQEIGDSWRDLGEELDFVPGELDNFKSQGGNLKEIATKMLDTWIQKKDPPLSELKRALIDSGHTEIANKL